MWFLDVVLGVLLWWREVCEQFDVVWSAGMTQEFKKREDKTGTNSILRDWLEIPTLRWQHSSRELEINYVFEGCKSRRWRGELYPSSMWPLRVSDSNLFSSFHFQRKHHNYYASSQNIITHKIMRDTKNKILCSTKTLKANFFFICSLLELPWGIPCLIFWENNFWTFPLVHDFMDGNSESRVTRKLQQSPLPRTVTLSFKIRTSRQNFLNFKPTNEKFLKNSKNTLVTNIWRKPAWKIRRKKMTKQEGKYNQSTCQ